MVKDSNPKNLSRMQESLRAIPVFPARSRIARRVVMKEDQGRAAITHGRCKYLTRVHNGCAQAADRYEHFAYQLVFGIQVQGEEMFSAGGEESSSVSMIKLPAV
jgi:hypothetical protein